MPANKPPEPPGRPAGRDRDPLGRPQSARPRDAAGRPLTRDASGTAQITESELAGLAQDPRACLAEARRLAEAGRPFTAHEVLEARWKACPAEERPLWRSLAQVAVGLTHLQRGNLVGARALLTRGAAGLADSADAADPAGPPAYLLALGLDVGAVIGWASALAAALPSADDRAP